MGGGAKMPFTRVSISDSDNTDYVFARVLAVRLIESVNVIDRPSTVALSDPTPLLPSPATNPPTA